MRRDAAVPGPRFSRPAGPVDARTKEPVREFLECLRPPMASLVTEFHQAGVVSEEDLDGASLMAEAELKEFLRSDLKLKSFQVRIIYLGFVKYRERLACNTTHARGTL